MFSAINRKVKRFAIQQRKKKPIVNISDTTLRDGIQMPGVRITLEQKVEIARALRDAGVDSIEAGFPAASDADVAAVTKIAKDVRGPFITALSRCTKEDVELCAECLRGASPLKRTITLFIGTSPVHREYKHNLTKSQIIDKVSEAISHAEKYFQLIAFGAEDATRTEPEFLYELYENAIQAGAINIGLSDTVGILTPNRTRDWIRSYQDNIPSIDDVMIGTHFHNDLGLATANCLAAIEEGAHTVQGTMTGIGERAGNVALEEVIVALHLNHDTYRKRTAVDTTRLSSLCELVASITGFHPPANKAVIGKNIFRTEAGIHQHGILKNPETYTPFPPELIGAGPVQLVLGRNSGRAAVRHHLEQTGLEINEETVDQVLAFLKEDTHEVGDYEEISEFLDKLQPYMSEDDYLSQKRAATQAATRAAQRAVAPDKAAS